MLEQIADTFTIEKLPRSEVTLTGEIPFEAVTEHRAEALKHIGESINLPGFRKGHIPEDLLIKTVGEIAVLEEAVEHFISHFYPTLVVQKKLDVLGRPQVKITKLAPGNPIGLTIQTAVFPEIKLPDYKKIAKGVSKDATTEVAEEEINNAKNSILKAYTPKSAGGEEAALPVLDDGFVQKLGEFKDVSDFTEKLTTQLKTEKEQAAKEKYRTAISEAIMDKTPMDIPTVFVESEQLKMLAQMKDDIKRFGMSFEDYLKRINKSEDDLRTEFASDAEKRAKLQLVLNAIAEKEEIKISAEDIEKEAQHILEHFKDADRERVHIYVESVMKNEKTLKLLEGTE